MPASAADAASRKRPTGTCQVCKIPRAMNKKREIGPHRGPRTTLNPTGSVRCWGVGLPPMEDVPLSAEVVDDVVRQTLADVPGAKRVATAISLALQRELGPRLRQMEGQHAMLVDLANLGAALLWEEITPDSREALYGYEVLAEEIAELRARYPRLNPKDTR